MNIAYISADFGVPIFGYKGASIHVREMVKALLALGHHVTVFSPAMHDGESVDSEQARSIESLPGYKHLCRGVDNQAVAFVEVRPGAEHAAMQRCLAEVDRFLGRKTRIRQEIRNLTFNLDLLQAARPFFESRPPDLVYERYTLFHLAGLRLAREFKVPHILEVNAPLAYEQERMRGLEMKELALQLECRAYRETDHVLVVSRELKRHVLNCQVPEDRITVLPNAVDIETFDWKISGDAVRQRYGLQSRLVIGFVGSLKPWHGTDTLVEAFAEVAARVPQAHLLLVGDGPMRERLEQQIREKGLAERVTITGKVDYDHIPAHIAAMDIATAPYRPAERFYFSPIKLFEYMAMAKPVVAGKLGQVTEIIDHDRNGLLFTPGRVPELAAALERLLGDAELRQRLGKTARAWVAKERTWTGNAARVIDIAQRLTLHKLH